MRILIIEGPGSRPAGYVRTVSAALQHLGHRVVARRLDGDSVWTGRRKGERLAGLLCRRMAPDVVHVLSTEPWLAEAFAGRGIPVVHTSGDRPSRSDWVAVPSRLAMDRVAGAGQGLDYRVGVLPYAVRVDAPPESVGHYAVARIDPADTQASRWLHAAAGRIPFVPLRSRGALRRARFVISLSSRADAWPAGIAEAMAAGRPVLATWGGAAPEILREGVTGYLSAPGDIDTLVHGMERLWDHPDEALRMGLAARELARDLFEPEAHARTLMRWYMRAGASRLAI